MQAVIAAFELQVVQLIPYFDASTADTNSQPSPEVTTTVRLNCIMPLYYVQAIASYGVY